MIIDCISDLHGHYPRLKGGDLLIVAGDLFRDNTLNSQMALNSWLYVQKYKKCVVIAGNHDYLLQKIEPPSLLFSSWNTHTGEQKSYAEYLCDSGTEFEYVIDGFPEEDEGFLPSGKRKLKIWGSPWTKTFEGMNPHCKAFTCDTEEELAEKWALIPDDTDILVTHSPPWGIKDKTISGEFAGSRSLAYRVGHMETPPKLWVWGHIHEGHGRDLPIRSKPCIMINASHVNEHYEPVNKPIRIEL